MSITKTACSVDGCEKPRQGCQDVCHGHYERRRRTGDASTPLRLRGAPTVERFLSKVEKTTSCWLWTAALNESGYGRFGREVTELAHRVAYELFVGPIPAGLEIDHLCRVRRCVNPEHLEPVTGLENLRRARPTRCKRGHAFTPENTYRWRNMRRCRTCRRDYDRGRKHMPQHPRGGGLDEARMGVVSVGGQQVLGTCSPASGPPCNLCGEVAGHTAQCPVVS